MRKINVVIASFLAMSLSGCTVGGGLKTSVNLNTYTPVVSADQRVRPSFDADLESCRTAGKEVFAEIKSAYKQSSKSFSKNFYIGALTNTATGAAGAASVGAGAAQRTAVGAASGAANSATKGNRQSANTQIGGLAQAHADAAYKPQLAIDNCMTDKGYTLLQ